MPTLTVLKLLVLFSGSLLLAAVVFVIGLIYEADIHITCLVSLTAGILNFSVPFSIYFINRNEQSPES